MFKKISEILVLALTASLVSPMIAVQALETNKYEVVAGEKSREIEILTIEDEKITMYESIESGNRFAKVIKENGEISEISYDKSSDQLSVDGEILDIKVSEINTQEIVDDRIQSRWQKPSTGEIFQAKYSVYFPYRESVIVLAAAVAVYAPWLSAKFIATSIGGMIGIQSGVNLEYQTYRSESRHYSTYNGTYYHRIKHKNSTFVTSGSRKLVLSDSGWIDPIRPY